MFISTQRHWRVPPAGVPSGTPINHGHGRRCQLPTIHAHGRHHACAMWILHYIHSQHLCVAVCYGNSGVLEPVAGYRCRSMQPQAVASLPRPPAATHHSHHHRCTTAGKSSLGCLHMDALAQVTSVNGCSAAAVSYNTAVKMSCPQRCNHCMPSPTAECVANTSLFMEKHCQPQWSATLASTFGNTWTQLASLHQKPAKSLGPSMAIPLHSGEDFSSSGHYPIWSCCHTIVVRSGIYDNFTIHITSSILLSKVKLLNCLLPIVNVRLHIHLCIKS